MSATSKRSILTGALSLALSLPCVPLALAPARVLAAAPEADPATVRVVVDASGLGADADYWEEEVTDRIGTEIAEAGYEVVDAATADVTVRIRLYYYSEEDLDYQLDTEISAGEEIVRLETVACPRCIDDQLREKMYGQDTIIDGITTALERADEAEEDDGGEDDGGEDGGEEIKPIGALGGAGIGMAVVGLGGAITGVISLSSGRVYDQGPEGVYVASGKDNRPPGYALVGVGAAVTVTGVVMLAVDLSRRAKQRKKTGDAKATLVPTLSPTTAGLSLVGRF